jgi:iron complex outermembrane receptor protein
MPNRTPEDDAPAAAAIGRRPARRRAAFVPAALAVLLHAARAGAQGGGPFAPPEAPPPPAPSAPTAPPAPGAAPDVPNDYWDPPVVTPTGQPSRVSESPSTTFVITGEEVRHAGATTIPEILRRVPGMDVRMLGATDGQIGPRGFAFEVADRVLVMVDGRTAYVDFFGGTAYEMLPVSPLDIDRIEVVLGPGASVYGNKAMLGTLNIITRSAAAFPGPEARLDVGYQGDVRVAARDGIVWGNWRTRVTGLFRRTAPYPVDDPMGNMVFTQASPAGGGTVAIGYAPDPGAEFSLEGGVMTGDTYLLPTGSAVFPFRSTLAYLKADGRVGLGGPGSPYGDLRLKAVFNFGWIKSSAFVMNQLLNANYQTPYAEVSHEFRYRVGALSMQARWGGEVRLNVLDSTITANEQPIWNVAAFASNEAVLGRWRLTTGLRVDRQRLTDYTVSPRVSIVFSPAPSHQLRLAYNSGYNNPSLIQNFARFPLNGLQVQGSPDLLPERIYYGELGYGGTITRWLRLFASGFAYRMTNSITLAPTIPFDPVTMAPTGPVLWQNSPAAANAVGGETGFEVAPSRVISGYAHYAYLHLTAAPGHPYEGASNLGSPTNKVTAGIRLDLPRRIYLTADGQYFGAASIARVDPMVMTLMPPTLSTFSAHQFDAIVMLHARTGIVFDNGFDFSVAATNLLNTTEAQLLGAQNPRLRVMATIAYYTP